MKQVRVRWLNIETLTWSPPEIVDVGWAGGREDWGDRAQVLLKAPGAESFVAVIDVVNPAPEIGIR